MPACKLTWYQGTHKPQLWKENPAVRSSAAACCSSAPTGGCSFPTTASTCCCPRPSSRTSSGPSRSFPIRPASRPSGSWRFKNGTPTGSPFSYAGLLTEANHLGNVAYRAGTKIVWDTAQMRVTNTRAADPFLSREPRAGWKLA